MPDRLRYDRRFKELLNRLPGDIRSIARRTIARLASDPFPSKAKELVSHPGYYRLWLPRNYRLVWCVPDEEEVVDLLYVGPKSDRLYSNLGLGR